MKILRRGRKHKRQAPLHLNFDCPWSQRWGPPQGWRGGLGVCMMRFTNSAARKRGARPAHRRDHRQSEREERKKRGTRSIRTVRRRQENQGQKRHILVHTRLVAHCHSSFGRYSGSRRRCAVVFDAVRRLSFSQKAVRRQRLSRDDFRDAIVGILPSLHIEIVKRSDRAKGFVILPKRWIVERSIAWLNRRRRLAKDWENLNRTALAFLHFASIRLMLRKLCNPLELSNWTLRGTAATHHGRCPGLRD